MKRTVRVHSPIINRIIIKISRIDVAKKYNK